MVSTIVFVSMFFSHRWYTTVYIHILNSTLYRMIFHIIHSQEISITIVSSEWQPYKRELNCLSLCQANRCCSVQKLWVQILLKEEQKC